MVKVGRGDDEHRGRGISGDLCKGNVYHAIGQYIGVLKWGGGSVTVVGADVLYIGLLKIDDGDSEQ